MDWKIICLLCFVVVIYNISTSKGTENQASSSQEQRAIEVPDNRTHKEKKKKSGHIQVGKYGEITYKKIDPKQIMGSIQMGIEYVMQNLSSGPGRNLLMTDFVAVTAIAFPCQGSDNTPKHEYPGFTFKWYAPIIFHYFRELYGIDPDVYQKSFCSKPLKELSNPGASGSLFYKTHDDKFIMKTLQKNESEFLQKLLPGYHLNFNQNPSSLLPKFYGLYRYQCNTVHISPDSASRKIRNVRLVAMNNLIPSDIEIDEKYDLKGSTHKRLASESERNKEKPTFKDLDFIAKHPNGIFLEPDAYAKLIKTLRSDVRVLQSFKIMDYSLLMGVHYVKPDKETKIEQIVRGLFNGVDKEKNGLPLGVFRATSGDEKDLLLFIGIIDILQSYRLLKKLEHLGKSKLYDSKTISVHRPGFYATRFFNFMKNSVFSVKPNSILENSLGSIRTDNGK